MNIKYVFSTKKFDCLTEMSNQGRYSEQLVLDALASIKNGNSISHASKLYRVPRSTLSDRNRGLVPIETKMGPTTILSKEEESQLIQWNDRRNVFLIYFEHFLSMAAARKNISSGSVIS